MLSIPTIQGVPKNALSESSLRSYNPSKPTSLACRLQAASGDLSDLSACRMMILKVRFFGTPCISHFYIFVYFSYLVSLSRIVLDEFGTQLTCILIFLNKYQLHKLYEIENTAWQRGTQVNGCMFVPSYPLGFCYF